MFFGDKIIMLKVLQSEDATLAMGVLGIGVLVKHIHINDSLI